MPVRPRSGLSTRVGGAVRDDGFMMVAILIGMAVAAILMTAALPKWGQQTQRARDEELIFRGEQYARAIVLYMMKNRGAYPPTIDILVEQKYLRKKWKDPITNDDFALVGFGLVNLPGPGSSTPVGGQSPTPVGGQTPTPAGGGRSQGGGPAQLGASGQQPGISGVRSKSSATSIKIYQQQQQYNYWQFDASLIAGKMGINMAQLLGQGQGGRGPQGQPGRGGQQGGPGGGGVPGGRGGQGGGPGRVGGPGGDARGATPPPVTGRVGRGGGLD
jgi:type II secretory pathway pseudopilin PulG